MEQYYLGGDVSKGYSDFVILDGQKRRVEENFQLDDTIVGHSFLYDRLLMFFEEHPAAELYAAVESTGGYENNWYNTLHKFQSSLNIKTARLNPAGVCKNNEAGLKRIITDKISAQGVAEYLIAHPEKVIYQQQDYWASLRKQWSFNELPRSKLRGINPICSVLLSAASCGELNPKEINVIPVLFGSRRRSTTGRDVCIFLASSALLIPCSIIICSISAANIFLLDRARTAARSPVSSKSFSNSSIGSMLHLFFYS